MTPRVFVQKSLVTLKLSSHSVWIKIHEDDVIDVDLPHLKTLWLDDVLIEDDAMFVRLIASCPVLEELVMIDMKWHKWENFFVASASLNRLKIIWSWHVEVDQFNRCPRSVSFDTPNLLYLKYRDHIAGQYSVVNFNSLIEAKINLNMIGEIEEEDEEEDVIVGDNAGDFIKGISCVQKLYLSQTTIQVLHNNCHVIPEFKNLIHLTIQSFKGLGWNVIPQLLKNCPRFEKSRFRRTLPLSHSCMW